MKSLLVSSCHGGVSHLHDLLVLNNSNEIRVLISQLVNVTAKIQRYDEDSDDKELPSVTSSDLAPIHPVRQSRSQGKRLHRVYDTWRGEHCVTLSSQSLTSYRSIYENDETMQGMGGEVFKLLERLRVVRAQINILEQIPLEPLVIEDDAHSLTSFQDIHVLEPMLQEETDRRERVDEDMHRHMSGVAASCLEEEEEEENEGQTAQWAVVSLSRTVKQTIRKLRLVHHDNVQNGLLDDLESLVNRFLDEFQE